MVHVDESDACGNHAQSSAISTHKAERQTLRVMFSTVKVYHFERAQGSETVPTAGAQSLGMTWAHHTLETFSLDEDGVATKGRKSLDEISEHFRRLMLTDAGVQADPSEAVENDQIRESRRN
ncbi:cysteine/serine-rich nuclear protein 3, partial [Aphelenchoides avenae]